MKFRKTKQHSDWNDQDKFDVCTKMYNLWHTCCTVWSSWGLLVQLCLSVSRGGLDDMLCFSSYGKFPDCAYLCIYLVFFCQFHLTLKVQSSNVNVHTHSYGASATNCNVGRCFFNILHFFSWTQIFSIVTWLTWWQLLFSNWHLMLYLLISSILIFHPLTYDLWFIFL